MRGKKGNEVEKLFSCLTPKNKSLKILILKEK